MADWTGDMIIQLETLWAEGHSTAAIGRSLGVSKNAVVGKSHRLDLPSRPNPIKRDGIVGPRKPRLARGRPNIPALASMLGGNALMKSPRIIASLGQRPPLPPATPRMPAPAPKLSTETCQWIENSARPWKFCQEHALFGGAWCVAHRKRVYVLRRVAEAA